MENNKDSKTENIKKYENHTYINKKRGEEEMSNGTRRTTRRPRRTSSRRTIRRPPRRRPRRRSFWDKFFG